MGERRSYEVGVRSCCRGSSDRSLMVNPLSYLSFKPVFQDWCNKGCGMCCSLCATRHVKGRKEGNVLFNDALNTFYLRLYGVRHMVKDHSDSERGNPLPPHGLLFSINSKGSFIWPSHRQDSTSRGALAGTRNSSMGTPHEGSIRRPIAPGM